MKKIEGKIEGKERKWNERENKIGGIQKREKWKKMKGKKGKWNKIEGKMKRRKKKMKMKG